MVVGLDIFQSHFAQYKEQYILIGGAAIDLLHEEVGLEFRGTKDLDIVLCLESLDNRFAGVFWDFVRAGKYKQRERSTGRPEFFRFLKPENKRFPFMLELFSRKPIALEVPKDQHVVPIPGGEDAASLSVILLDDDYYSLISKGVRELSGIQIVRPEYLILMKARAFLDLTSRRGKGERIDEKDIKKHKNDVFRLYRLISPELSVELSAYVANDVRAFLASMEKEDIDLMSLGVEGQEKKSILATLKKIFGL